MQARDPYDLLEIWFKTKIQIKENGCWEWVGCRIWNGYGRVRNGKRPVLAHRRIYRLLVGPIPRGKVLDHSCRNRPCVNPAHLRPMTGKENVLLGQGPTAINARKTHCIRGHEIPAERGQCRACQKLENSGLPCGRKPRTNCKEGHLLVQMNGYKYCRICHAERERRLRAELQTRKAAA